MLKKYLLVVAILLCHNVVYAQLHEIKEPETVQLSNSYIGAFFGVSVPIDQYAASLDRENSGYAKTHVKINFDGAYVIARNLGVAGSFGHFINGTDATEYFTKFKDFAPEESAIANANWKNTYFALGPFFSLPESKIYFEGKALLGINKTVMPQLQHSETPYITRYETASWSPAMIIGTGLGYRLTPQWRVVLQTEYFVATPKVEVEHLVNDGLEINSSNSYIQRVTHFGISVGMQLDLTAKIDRGRL